MIVVPDANILLRIVEKTSGQHAIALAAVSALRLRGHTLRTVPQCFYEFWTVGTRPVANNGLGLSTAEVDQEVAKHLSFFPLLNDTPDLFSAGRPSADMGRESAGVARWRFTLSFEDIHKDSLPAMRLNFEAQARTSAESASSRPS